MKLLELNFGSEHKLESERKDRIASELGLDDDGVLNIIQLSSNNQPHSTKVYYRQPHEFDNNIYQIPIR